MTLGVRIYGPHLVHVRFASAISKRVVFSPSARDVGFMLFPSVDPGALRPNYATVVKINGNEAFAIPRRHRAAGSATVSTVKRIWYTLFCLLLLTQCCDGCGTNRLRSPVQFPTRITLEEAKRERNCAPPYDQLWCHNRGFCREVYESTEFKRLCICQEPFRGRRCETIYNELLTESAFQQQLETAALPLVITLLILLTCVVTCACYVFRRDARSNSIGSSDTSCI
uniref:EGF-like domain-containing protein n=1 Tax=Steinernema glaseri TaxID=37863 RepID=A0A1I7ZX69_9BILA